MSKTKRKLLQQQREQRMVAEGRARQEKYTKMPDLLKCGYVSSQYGWVKHAKNRKNVRARRYSKGDINEVVIVME